MGAAFAAAPDDGQSLQARQLRDERKHGRRALLVGRANQHGIELARRQQIFYFVSVSNGENEVLEADAGRVEERGSSAQEVGAPCAVLERRLRVGSEGDEQ
jgi:hypothetical protein